jgi:predicted small lipoprotein YifL
MSKRKTICLMLTFVLLLTLFAGCGQKPASENTPTPTPQQTETSKPDESGDQGQEEADDEEAAIEEVEKPDEIGITKTYYFGDASDNPEWKEKWAAAMEEQYGIKFSMTFPPRSNYTEKINLILITSGDLKGLVQLFTPDEAIKMYEDGAIEDLSEYLKDNAVWNSMPEDFRTMYEVDGKILASLLDLQEIFSLEQFVQTGWKIWALICLRQLKSFMKYPRPLPWMTLMEMVRDDTVGITAQVPGICRIFSKLLMQD